MNLQLEAETLPGCRELQCEAAELLIDLVAWRTSCPHGQNIVSPWAGQTFTTSLTWGTSPTHRAGAGSITDRPLAVSKQPWGADTMQPCLWDYFLFG